MHFREVEASLEIVTHAVLHVWRDPLKYHPKTREHAVLVPLKKAQMTSDWLLVPTSINLLVLLEQWGIGSLSLYSPNNSEDGIDCSIFIDPKRSPCRCDVDLVLMCSGQRIGATEKTSYSQQTR